MTAWLNTALTEAAILAVCIEARQAKAAMAQCPNKTDRNKCARDRADHAHRLVSSGSRKEPTLPLAGLAESLLAVIEVMTKEAEKLPKRLLEDVRVEPTCGRLMRVLGVRPLTPLAFRTITARPVPKVSRRWRSSRPDEKTANSYAAGIAIAAPRPPETARARAPAVPLRAIQA